jgi:hypothetical protein
MGKKERYAVGLGIRGAILLTRRKPMEGVVHLHVAK